MPDLVVLRYTGEQSVSFLDHGIGQVEPGGTFTVPADDAERFTRRADIQLAGEPPVTESGASGKPKGGKGDTGPGTQDTQEEPAGP